MRGSGAAISMAVAAEVGAAGAVVGLEAKDGEEILAAGIAV